MHTPEMPSYDIDAAIMMMKKVVLMLIEHGGSS